MKKIIGLVLSALIMVSSLMAGPLDRYFEFKYDMQLGLSNNAISLNDVLVKDLQIDLKKIADGLPSEGLIFDLNAKPQFGMNLDLRFLWIGLNAGVEASGKLIVAKDLFDFLGNGVDIGETMSFEAESYMDVFTYTSLTYGMKLGKFKLEVVPSLFIPVFSVSGKVANLTYRNGDDGSVSVHVNSDMNIYTLVDFNDVSSDVGSYFGNAGFDIAGTFEMPISRKSVVGVNARIPIVPGRLPYLMHETAGFDMDFKISDIIGDENFNFDDKITQTEPKFETKNSMAYINRPFKLNGYVDFKPFGSWIDLKAGAGFGVYHPFVENPKFYPEYLLSAQLSIINLLRFGVTSEYTDQIFRHGIQTAFNVRVFELDVGAYMQSASFVKSFDASGFSAYVAFAFGF